MEPLVKDEHFGQLSLNDELAIERTRLANDRTLLSFIRTSLYFSIAGLTISSLLEFDYDWLIATLFFIIAIFLLSAGLIRYFNLRKKLRHGKFEYDKIFMHDLE